MPNPNLATYLNDHLAGSVAAVEMLTYLEEVHRPTNLSETLANVRVAILADRQELDSLMSSLGITASPPRKALGWITEKLAETKLALDDRIGGPLHTLEALEAIALGIDGKRALWHALGFANIRELHVGDFHRLGGLAVEQRAQIESARLEAALLAFAE